MEFSAVQTARLERIGDDDIRITEIGEWPWGPNWEWIEVPLMRWSTEREPQGISVLPPPRVSPTQVENFLVEYKNWLATEASQRDYSETETTVARLFAAAVSGNEEAQRLFATMRGNAGLDGAAAETYMYAEVVYERWFHRRDEPTCPRPLH